LPHVPPLPPSTGGIIRQRPRIGRLVMRTNRWINRITTLWGFYLSV
jgi:hypothetical protein